MAENNKSKNKNKSSNFINRFINDFELYLAAYLFIFLTIMLFAQVVSRYVFNNAVTWTEELANMVFVFLTYLGVSAGVKHRKHLSIDFVVQKVSFKKKRIMLIVSDIIFILFCIYMLFPMFTIINGYNGLGGASSPLLGIPKVISYSTIPVCFVLTIFRLVQDIVKLLNEDEQEIGASKPTLDLGAAEAEWEKNKKLIEGGMD